MSLGDEEIRARIWRIADGIPLNLGNMTVRKADSGKLLVLRETSMVYFENITKKILKTELEELKSSFVNLQESFDELNDVVKLNSLEIVYHMIYKTGQSSIGLCSEINGEIIWYI